MSILFYYRLSKSLRGIEYPNCSNDNTYYLQAEGIDISKMIKASYPDYGVSTQELRISKPVCLI